MRLPPGGVQHRLVDGDQEVIVTEAGATLRSYTTGDCPVVQGFDEFEVCPGYRGQLLLPWPNRIGDGRYRFGDREHQLAIDEPARGNAIHGLTRFASWVGERVSPCQVEMHHRLLPSSGYPFCLDLTAVYALDRSGLTVRIGARNVGGAPAPFGAGAHPYLQVGTPVIDHCRLSVPARTALITDGRGLPAGKVPVERTALDFMAPRSIAGAILDTSYTDLIPGADGIVRVGLESPAGRRLVLWCEPGYRWLQIYSGDGLPSGERRQALAVEPMTCPPDAFRSGEDLLVLEPGQAFQAGWGIDVTGFRG